MKVRSALVAAAQGFWLSCYNLVCSVTLFIWCTLSIALITTGVGVLTTPPLLTLLRRYADLRRSQAAEWTGRPVASPYPPLTVPRPGVGGRVEHCFALVRHPATWRDLSWLLIDMTAGYVTALWTFVCLPYGLYGLVLAAGVWRPIYHAAGGDWYTFVHVTTQGEAYLAGLIGLLLMALGLVIAVPALRLHFRLSAAFLAPTEAMVLARRVERLTETRHDAVDTSAAELRRIERDLHDGAQARLVAMGMSLGTVEALIERDPQQAKALIAKARESSAEALAELRDLVRGIHPPVLAERGLADAVQALALRMPLPVETEMNVPGRMEEPVESAAYFAISEVLTNAAKHSGAGQVWLDVEHTEGALRIAVTDDGRGGAVMSAGSGLAGVQRRLGAFDGVLALSSPPGGPTMVTMEIPCALTDGPPAR